MRAKPLNSSSALDDGLERLDLAGSYATSAEVVAELEAVSEVVSTLETLGATLSNQVDEAPEMAAAAAKARAATLSKPSKHLRNRPALRSHWSAKKVIECWYEESREYSAAGLDALDELTEGFDAAFVMSAFPSDEQLPQWTIWRRLTKGSPNFQSLRRLSSNTRRR